jgi:hypothetical protein
VIRFPTTLRVWLYPGNYILQFPLKINHNNIVFIIFIVIVISYDTDIDAFSLTPWPAMQKHKREDAPRGPKNKATGS